MPNFGVGPLNGGMTVYYVQNGLNVTAPPKVYSQNLMIFKHPFSLYRHRDSA